jgi:dihydrofolate synthase/folylpolyglutamate synthase
VGQIEHYNVSQVHVEECIAVDGRPLHSTDFSSVIHEVQRAQSQSIGETSAGLTNFEMLTAAAYLTFSRSVDVAVVEVGVGGLRDATNVITRPAVSVITSIALDHSDLLGETVADIAKEKAGILKPGCPAVIGPVDPVAAEQIEEYARHVRAGELIWSSPATLMESTPTAVESLPSHHHHRKWARHSGLEYPLVLGGDYQLANSAVALDALRVLRKQTKSKVEPSGVNGGRVECSNRAMVEGMRSVRWPGRLQWSQWPAAVAASCDYGCGSNCGDGQDTSIPWPVLLDGAHNPAAAEALCAYVDGEIRQGQSNSKVSLQGAGQGTIVWVIALSKGKDARSLLSTLLRDGDSVVFVPFPVGALLRRVHSCACTCPKFAAEATWTSTW